MSCSLDGKLEVGAMYPSRSGPGACCDQCGAEMPWTHGLLVYRGLATLHGSLVHSFEIMPPLPVCPSCGNKLNKCGVHCGSLEISEEVKHVHDSRVRI
jgi:hypothetical protein